MPEQWLSVAEAAASMKVHPRTIERRVSAGKIENRRNDDGQVQVLVNLPEQVEPVSSDALETVKELANQQVDIAAGSASALVRVAQEQAMRAENQLVLARQDAGRYRHEVKMAMAVVGGGILVVLIAVAWCTYAITQSQADARRAADNAAQSAERARIAEAHSEADHNRLDDAILARANAEGELKAYKTELNAVVEMTKPKPAATQPTTFIKRLSDAFASGN